MATVTASARAVTYSNPGIHIPENFGAVLQSGLDEVYKREMAQPEEGMQFLRTRGMDKRNIKFQSHYGLGTVGQNRDADVLPYDEKGLGFDWTLSANTYRGAIRIERELQEDEMYGTISDLQSELVKSLKHAKELVIADVFNRALGAAGAPFVCEDGMYLIDSARPNAYKPAGTWSNLDSTSAITANNIYQIQLNFAAHTDERGKLSPLKMNKMIVRPSDEKTVWEILRSDLRPTDAMNAKNFQYGRFEYMVYNYLTAATAFYLAGDPKSSSNELLFGERSAAQLETWDDGNNPDIVNQRIRARFGIGCGRPYIWRAHTVS